MQPTQDLFLKLRNHGEVRRILDSVAAGADLSWFDRAAANVGKRWFRLGQHHLQIAKRLNEHGIWNTGPIDRGFMDSIYFRDPNGQLIEMACYKFTPPEGYTLADVLDAAHRLRVAAGDYNVADSHLADAIAELTERRAPTLELA